MENHDENSGGRRFDIHIGVCYDTLILMKIDSDELVAIDGDHITDEEQMECAGHAGFSLALLE